MFKKGTFRPDFKVWKEDENDYEIWEIKGYWRDDAKCKFTAFLDKYSSEFTIKLFEKTIDDTPEFKVALLGRPNAGKSSLMNLLLDQDFSIVSPVAGTTREALRKRIALNKNVIELIDTAGVRKRSNVDTELESMMVTNALQAAKRAHIVLCVMDVSEPELTAQELKLASYAFDNGAAVIVLFNKQDLLDDYASQQLASSIDQYKYFLNKLEITKFDL